MKIITKDNFDRDIFEEVIVAENVNEWYGKEFVKLHNDKYWNGESDTYLALVEDDYKCYNGYELYL
ncbi:hypothetical protein ABD91_00475 [Lysinibacillus sphaericus]|uniref:hypothetical protein n=1 Tax=Lysinibacillus sphaericus TaxID=1421 RepID=UPI0018CF6AF7|nr:hypothetical protein [Lysinibacillus sphaericus]MBG9689402.1 hypothetical protein [Lysinibacillus sphaericus]